MEKLNFKFENLPSTKTPLNAENLNLIIDKINEIIDELNKISKEKSNN